MAARPGEEKVATLFGDIHYFYGPETDYPPHHRFNKGSYVYLFENAHEGRARIEIANQPGTEQQDAFTGYLDRTGVRYSYKHSCMVSVTVHDVPNQEEWHLPTYDPQNQNIYHYKLQSLDIYFWSPRDAHQFVNGVRRVLPANQVDIQDEPVAPPPPPPQQQQQAVQPNSMSSVVQKLENVALGNGSGAGGVPSFAGPPASAVSSSSNHPTPPQQQQQQPAFVPMAYNPAAPAAPETIRPREKTPPPPDATHDPLHQTLVNDATTPFSPGLVVPAGLGPLSPGVPPPTFQGPPGAPTFAGPPSVAANAAAAAVPGPPGLARASTMPTSPFSPGYPQYTTAPAVASVPAGTVAGVPVTSAAVAGFSTYNYSTQTTLPATTAGAAAVPATADATQFAVHQQLYRPTEGEAAVQYKPKKEPRGRLEENAGRLERGVTGMFKKFEKKFG